MHGIILLQFTLNNDVTAWRKTYCKVSFYVDLYSIPTKGLLKVLFECQCSVTRLQVKD